MSAPAPQPNRTSAAIALQIYNKNPKPTILFSNLGKYTIHTEQESIMIRNFLCCYGIKNVDTAVFERATIRLCKLSSGKDFHFADPRHAPFVNRISYQTRRSAASITAGRGF